jgi:hypothetical protein
MSTLQKATSKSTGSSSRSSLQRHLPKYLQVCYEHACSVTPHCRQGLFRNRFDTDPSERKASQRNILLRGDRRKRTVPIPMYTNKIFIMQEA